MAVLCSVWGEPTLSSAMIYLHVMVANMVLRTPRLLERVVYQV